MNQTNINDCPICIEPLIDDITTTVCGHQIHGKCLQQLYEYNHLNAKQTSCPLCMHMLIKKPHVVILMQPTSSNSLHSSVNISRSEQEKQT